MSGRGGRSWLELEPTSVTMPPTSRLLAILMALLLVILLTYLAFLQSDRKRIAGFLLGTYSIICGSKDRPSLISGTTVISGGRLRYERIWNMWPPRLTLSAYQIDEASSVQISPEMHRIISFDVGEESAKRYLSDNGRRLLNADLLDSTGHLEIELTCIADSHMWMLLDWTDGAFQGFLASYASGKTTRWPVRMQKCSD